MSIVAATCSSPDFNRANVQNWTCGQRLAHDCPMHGQSRYAASDILVGCEEIGRAFNRSPCTVRRWLKTGLIPFRRLPDGSAVTTLGAITQWVMLENESPE